MLVAFENSELENKLAKLGDAIAISKLKLSMTHSPTDWQGYVLGDAISSEKVI